MVSEGKGRTTDVHIAVRFGREAGKDFALGEGEVFRLQLRIDLRVLARLVQPR